ncbi:MAG: S8 family serine peptidase, partial [Planctomycetota bacterium]
MQPRPHAVSHTLTGMFYALIGAGVAQGQAAPRIHVVDARRQGVDTYPMLIRNHGIEIDAGINWPAHAEFDSPADLADTIGVVHPPGPASLEAGLHAPRHTGRLLVRFRPGRSAAAKSAAHRAAAGAKLLKDYRVVPDLALVQVSPASLPDALKSYRADPNVIYAEPDLEVRIITLPNDPDFGLLWGMHNTGQTIDGDPGTPGADIRAVYAWDQWTGDPDFRIAVIDTGVNYNHPDLAANIWTNPGEIPNNGVDDDGNGWIDDVHGYDFLNLDGDPMDDHYHGSHVAGTIGAVADNDEGVVGVNWQCSIVALKFLDDNGSGPISAAIDAMQYVVDNN